MLLKEESQLRVRWFNKYLKSRFGETVWKISVDGGFTCPNRDGRKGVGGCIYCDNNSFTPYYLNRKKNIKEQIEEGMRHLLSRRKIRKFLVYFQPYSATYAEPEVLKNMFNESLSVNNIVGIVVGTRPDCMDDKIVEVLKEFSLRTFLWVEMGLQSASEKTLEIINRKHTVKDFEKAVSKLRAEGIHVGTHVILGLPGETFDDWMKTASFIRNAGVESVKIHNIVVVKGTVLGKWYEEGKFKPPDKEEYIEGCVEFIKRVSPDVMIVRISSDVKKEHLISPLWALHKRELEENIKKRLLNMGFIFTR